MISIVKYLSEAHDLTDEEKQRFERYIERQRQTEPPVPGAAPKLMKKSIRKYNQERDRDPGTTRKVIKKGIQTMTGQD